VLVHQPDDIDGFSWSVSIQGKTRLAVVLCKGHNAAMDAGRPTLRAPAMSCDGVAVLDKDAVIACARRLVAMHDRNA